MFLYAFKRLLLTIPVMFSVFLITFSLGYFGPGDPLDNIYDLDYEPDPAMVRLLRVRYGLDRPFWVQFGDYVWDLARGDFGNSITHNRPVIKLIKRGLPISAQLGLGAALVLVLVGLPLGVIAAAKQNTWIDYWIIAISISVRSVPIFVMAPMLLIILVLKLDVFGRVPVGWHGIFAQEAILPVVLMALPSMLGIVRLTRTGVIEILGQMYVRTARAKGLKERLVLRRHVVKNAMTPVLTSMGLTLSGLITGALFVELIFGIPGFAGIGIEAFRARDYPVILATVSIGAFFLIISNLLVDVGYGLLDPRVRYD